MSLSPAGNTSAPDTTPGGRAARPSIIETVRSVGYRFLPPPA